MMDIIPSLAKDCEREDCALVDLGSTMTLMGFSQSYDKRGRPIERDPNTTTSNYECRTCGALWTVKQCGNEVTISTTLGATMTVELGAQ